MKIKGFKILKLLLVTAVIISLSIASAFSFTSCCLIPEAIKNIISGIEGSISEDISEEEEVLPDEELPVTEEEEPEKVITPPQEFTGTPASYLVSTLKVPGQAIDVDVGKEYAYLTNDLGVLYIIDIRDKENPEIVGKCSGITAANIVIVDGSYAYISYADWITGEQDYYTECGFYIVDISDERNPVVIGDYNTGENNKKTVYGLYIEGDFAYINTNIWGEDEVESALEIVDIKDRAAPKMVSSIEVAGAPASVCVKGNFAYINTNMYDVEEDEYLEESELYVINIKDKKAPVIVGLTSVPSNSWGMYAMDGFVYISSNVLDPDTEKYENSSLQIIDVSDSLNPVALGKVVIPGGAWEIDAIDSFIYVSDLDGGLYVVDIEDSASPFIVDSLNTIGDSYDITISGNYGYMADGFNGMLIVRLSDESAEKEGFFIDTDENVNYPPKAYIDVFGDEASGDYYEAKNPVYFSAAASFDPDRDELEYSWEVEGSHYSDGESTSYMFEEPGEYEVTLVVSDGVESDEVTETVKIIEKELCTTPTAEHSFTVEIEYKLVNNGPVKLTDIECFMRTPQTYYPYQIINDSTPSLKDTDEYYDDNWNLLTHFEFDGDLGVGEELIATIESDVTMYEFNFIITSNEDLEYDADDEDLKTYTKDDLFVDSDSPAIYETARDVTRGETNPVAAAKKLYDFVTGELHYDYPRAEEGDYEFMYASEILEVGKGVCADYAILYTALLRSVGIPARLAAGIPIYTILSFGENEIDVGHAWVEVKFPGYGWIPVDITMEDEFLSNNYYMDIATEKGPGYLYENTTMDWGSYYYDGFKYEWDGDERPDVEQSFIYRIKGLNMWDLILD